MSCGHAVTTESLTGWCRSLLDQGQYKFKCPALMDDTVEQCNKVWSYQEVRRLAVPTTEEMAYFEEKMARLAAEEYCEIKEGQYKFKCPALMDDTVEQCNEVWSYQEVRRLAVLTTEEMAYFEEKMARLAAVKYCEIKECPGCNTFVEREDLTNLCVVCTICQADDEDHYAFCWQCLNKWKGPMPRSDRCDNDGCVNLNLELLKNCKDTSLPQVQGVDKCPSIRACPTCGQRVEHDRTGCKNIICPRCQVEFCFVCLKLTSECLKTSSYFIPCRDGVAPRQTSIPVWHHN